MTNERLESFRRLGAAFAAGGERYDRLRPGYPDRAVTWLVEGHSQQAWLSISGRVPGSSPSRC
jgi:hypothetical protein